MTDNTNNPPPDVQQAAAKVQAWIDRNKPGGAAPPRESAFEKFRRLPRADVPATMPAWDPSRKDD